MFRSTVLLTLLFCVTWNATIHGNEPARIVSRKAYAMHRASAEGNLHTVRWKHLTLSDDGTLLAGVGVQQSPNQSSLRYNHALIAVWTLKTGKAARAGRGLDVQDQLAFAPDGKSLVAWGKNYESTPSTGETPLAFWDFSKPHVQRLLIPLSPERIACACGFSMDGKKPSLIVIGPTASRSLAYKFEPPKLIPKPKVEMLVRPTLSNELPQPDGGNTAETAILSRNGKVLVQGTGRNVRAVEVATGRVMSVSEARLGNTMSALQLAISRDGGRIAFGVQPPSEEEPSSIVIFDSASGRTLTSCTGGKGTIESLAMTPDGTRIVLSGRDKSVLVWDGLTGRHVATITGLTELSTAVAITSDGQFAVTGMASGEVDVWNIGEPSKDVPARPVDADKITKLIAAERPLPKRAPQTFAPAEMTKAQEELYLAHALRRLIDRGATLAEYPQNSPEVLALLDDALSKRDRAMNLGATAELVASFEKIPNMMKVIQDEAISRQKLILEHKASMRELMAVQKESEASMQLGWVMGLMSAVVGAFPTYSNQYDPITRSMLTVETGSLSPALTEYGLSVAINSLFEGLEMKGRIAEAEGLNDKTLRELLGQSLRKQATALATVSDPANLALKTLLGGKTLVELPESDNQKANRSTKDFDAIIAAMTARADQLKIALGRDEPFATANLIGLKSLLNVPRDKRVKEWPAMAETMAKLAHQVPPGAVYDRDRAAILAMAADLSSRAAAIELGNTSWTKAASPVAEASIQWLDDALKLFPLDPSGELREQKAGALCQSGRPASGYQLAKSLNSLRGHKPRYRFLLARAAHCAGSSDESIEELAIAIERLGLTDLDTIRNCPDLPKSSQRFRELTMIELEVVSEALLRGGYARIVNRSSFPLTNARFELTFPAGRGTNTTRLFVACLAPGEECRIAYNDNYIPSVVEAKGKATNKGTLRLLKSDQGKVTATVK